MARNEEKARTMFNRFTTMKEEYGRSNAKKSMLNSDNMSLGEVIEWRRLAVGKVVRNIKAIQNGKIILSPILTLFFCVASLGEFKIRELNDLINKAIRERSYWDHKVRDLGGNVSLSSGIQLLEADGRELPGIRGFLMNFFSIFSLNFKTTSYAHSSF